MLGTLESAFLVEPSGGFNIFPLLMSLGVAEVVNSSGLVISLCRCSGAVIPPEFSSCWGHAGMSSRIFRKLFVKK